MVFIKKYKFRIIGVLFGILVSVMLLTLGFWRTLLISLLSGLGYAFGSMMDGNAGVLNFIRRIFKQKDGDNTII